jgi:hypothetical protein
MRHFTGIVPIQPVGGIVTKNPSTTTQEQIDKQKQEAAIKEAMRQTELANAAKKSGK